MVTPEVFDKLRELQDILARKNRLELEISEAPKFLVKQEELLTGYKTNYIKKNEEYEEIRKTIGALKAELFETEQKLERAEKGMDGVTTQREYDALDREIQDATKKENELRKEILKTETAYKRLDDEIKEEEALIEQQEADLHERKFVLEKEIVEKQNELTVLAEGEQRIAPGLDSDTLFKFDRIIRNKQGVGIVPVQGNVCMGCHMILSAQFAIDVREGKNIMYCPYCSRILYYQENEEEMTEEMLYDDIDMGSLVDLSEPEDVQTAEDEKEA